MQRVGQKGRRMILFSLLAMVAFVLAACGGGGGAPGGGTSGSQPTYKVAMIIAQGGLGDQSYNDLANEGLQRAAKDFGNVEVQTIESPDVVNQGEALLRQAAQSGYDLVLTLEYSHFDVLPRVAKDFPDTVFGIVNAEVEGPNITSILFEEQQGSFLAGALAALVTKDTSIAGVNGEKIIGFIGGTKSPGIDKFLVGYEEGARFIDPEVKVVATYANNFGDPGLGKELALAQIEQGADIVYHVAGGTGAGVIEAAKEKGVFAIGVDSDQDGLAPGHVLTSMVKRVDVAVYDVVKRLSEGSLKAGTLRYGLDVGGVGLSEMKYTRAKIPADYIAKVEDLKQKVISGEIQVTDITRK